MAIGNNVIKKWLDTYASESDGYFYHITGGKKDQLATYEACYAMQWYLGFLKNGGSGHPYSLYADGFDFNKSFSKEANITSFKLEGKTGVIDEDAATITVTLPEDISLSGLMPEIELSEGAKLLESFMPETAEKILAQLGGGHVVEKLEILFQRLDLEEVMKRVEELHPKVKEEKEEEEEGIDIEAKPEITFEDFEKMQFQVGEIISCEAVKKSKKLLCSQVKIGSQVKQIVSGIKAHYTPEEMVGKKVMVLVNLKPAKLAGVLSEGMLLCAEDADGNLALMTPEKKMPAGAEIC